MRDFDLLTNEELRAEIVRLVLELDKAQIELMRAKEYLRLALEEKDRRRKKL